MNEMSFEKVCCVMCTYGRFETVRQSVGMFLWQDYPFKELVIFNTAPTPIILDPYLKSFANIKVVNQSKKSDGTPFESLGDVRTASLEHAEGDLYVCWDDDDFFLPWHLSEGIKRKGDVLAWKPEVSYWSHNGGRSMLGLMGNAMEASVIVNMDIVKKYGFSTGRSGAEHVEGGWYSYISDNNLQKIESLSPNESYAYVWGDERSSHKTSGHINSENNFENHKGASTDFGDEKELVALPFSSLSWILESIIECWVHRATREGMPSDSVTVEDIDQLINKVLEYYKKASYKSPTWMKPAAGVNFSEPFDDIIRDFVSTIDNFKEEITAIKRRFVESKKESVEGDSNRTN